MNSFRDKKARLFLHRAGTSIFLNGEKSSGKSSKIIEMFTGWHLNHTSTYCFKSYRKEQLCTTERFKLYKPRHSLSSKGTFIQAKEKFFCRGGWCPMDPKRDVEILPRNKPANFHFLYLDKDLALIYACQMCNGAITGGVDYFAQVLSRTPYPDWEKVSEVEKEMEKRKLDVKMENTFNYACPTEFSGIKSGIIDYNL